MKKLLSIVFALSVLTAGIFAQDATTEFAEKAADFSLDAAKKTAEFAVDQTKEALKDVEFPTGTWTDSNWNANWVMDVAKVHLSVMLHSRSHPCKISTTFSSAA